LFALFVVDINGTGLKQLTPYSLAGCCSSRWSPEGSDILFTSTQGLLFLVHPDGTHLRSIPTSSGSRDFAFAPSWSPDGNKIIFSMAVKKTHQVDLYTIDRDGKHLAQVTNTPEEEDLANWGTHPPAP
jgi:Tol biopolymer transport system component